jgi:hypothetical protein
MDMFIGDTVDAAEGVSDVKVIAFYLRQKAAELAENSTATIEIVAGSSLSGHTNEEDLLVNIETRKFQSMKLTSRTNSIVKVTSGWFRISRVDAIELNLKAIAEYRGDKLFSSQKERFFYATQEVRRNKSK